MQNPSESVGKQLARLLRVPLAIIDALMPDGEQSTNHVIGGYAAPPDGKSELQVQYEKDTEGWDVIWTEKLR